MAEKRKNFSYKGNGKLRLTGSASTVATITTGIEGATDAKTMYVACPITTDLDVLIKSVVEVGGFKMTLEEMNVYAERIKLSGGFGKFKVGANVVAGGGEVEIDKKPNSEVKMMVNLKYVRDRST